MLPYRADGANVLLAVRLTPKGGRDGLDGAISLSDGRMVLAARVRAVPENGAANAALIKVLAKALHMPASQISVVSGATSRLKTICIHRPMDIIAPALERLCHASD